MERHVYLTLASAFHLRLAAKVAMRAGKRVVGMAKSADPSSPSHVEPASDPASRMWPIRDKS